MSTPLTRGRGACCSRKALVGGPSRARARLAGVCDPAIRFDRAGRWSGRDRCAEGAGREGTGRGRALARQAGNRRDGRGAGARRGAEGRRRRRSGSPRRRPWSGWAGPWMWSCRRSSRRGTTPTRRCGTRPRRSGQKIGPGVRAAVPYVLETAPQERHAGPAKGRRRARQERPRRGPGPAGRPRAGAHEHCRGRGARSRPRRSAASSVIRSYNNAQVQANTRLRTFADRGAAASSARPWSRPCWRQSKTATSRSARGPRRSWGRSRSDVEGVVPALTGALRDRDAWSRQRAVEALARAARTSPAALAALVEALGHKDTLVRRAAAQVLAPAVAPGRDRRAPPT